jgi:hypothetical protein
MIPGIWELTEYAVNTVGNQGIPVIWSYQNAPRVGKSYIMLDYTTSDVPDHEYYDPTTDLEGNRPYASWRKAVMSMHFYCGSDSYRVASRLASQFASDGAVAKQVELDVSIGTRLMLQRVPALLNESQWEDRAIYQFDFYYTERTDDWVGWIGAVDIEGHYTGGFSDIPTPEHPDVQPGDGVTCNEFWQVITLWDDVMVGTLWDANLTVWDYEETLDAK